MVLLSFLEEFRHVRSVYQRDKKTIRPGSPLPEEADQSLGALELAVLYLVHRQFGQREGLVAERPGFRNLYEHSSLKK